MATATKPKPRLKNLDDLFLLCIDPASETHTAQDTQSSPHVQEKRTAGEIELNRLIPFDGHPFHLYEGERLDDMVESVRKNGVLVPIIVRCKGHMFEILSGHNRVNASKLAGLTAVPAITLENIPDEEAWIYVIETNLMQRSFSDMSHSEKAAVIAMQHSKMFSQGKRNDILTELKALENPHEIRENGTFRQNGEKSHTDELVGARYGLSSRVISRYLRINQLVAPLKVALDNDIIAFIPAVEVSFLSEDDQYALVQYIDDGHRVNMKKACIIRQYSDSGKLDKIRMEDILLGKLGQKPPPNRTPTVRVSKVVYSRYFQPNQSVKEVQSIVEKALEMYFNLE